METSSEQFKLKYEPLFSHVCLLTGARILLPLLASKMLPLAPAEGRIGSEYLLPMINSQVLISTLKQMTTLNLISLGSKFPFLSNNQVWLVKCC